MGFVCSSSRTLYFEESHEEVVLFWPKWEVLPMSPALHGASPAPERSLGAKSTAGNPWAGCRCRALASSLLSFCDLAAGHVLSDGGRALGRAAPVPARGSPCLPLFSFLRTAISNMLNRFHPLSVPPSPALERPRTCPSPRSSSALRLAGPACPSGLSSGLVPFRKLSEVHSFPWAPI